MKLLFDNTLVRVWRQLPRRWMLLSLLLVGLDHPQVRGENLAILEADITTQQQAMASGSITAEWLVRRCLERLDRHRSRLVPALAVDRTGSLRLARQRDRERNLGRLRGPLLRDGRALLDPGGSSSGIGTAAALWSAHEGEETFGSIQIPSLYNSLVGIRPTQGRISRHGLIPISRDQDTPGPMARTLRGAALLLEVMQGPDPDDPQSGL